MATSKAFGITKSGKEIEIYTIKNGNIELEIITYGAIIKSLKFPDRNGHLVEIVLGYDNLDDYENDKCYLGCMVGRVANRIKNGQFTLNGQHFQLAKNNGPNHLHGGIHGFNSKVWDVVSVNDSELKLHYRSEDGEEGYPGTVDVEVTYGLFESNVFKITVNATTTLPSPVNLTNHAYFNLSGECESNIYDHEISIQSDSYLPTDEDCLVTGVVAPVVNTLYDLRSTVNFGHRIDQLCVSKKPAFDTYYCLCETELKPVVNVYSPKTGIRLQAASTQPGIQFYSSHFLNQKGKKGRHYGKHGGFCLEFQGYPDAINKENFPSIILNPRDSYHHETSFIIDNSNNFAQ